MVHQKKVCVGSRAPFFVRLFLSEVQLDYELLSELLVPVPDSYLSDMGAPGDLALGAALVCEETGDLGCGGRYPRRPSTARVPHHHCLV